MKLRILYEDDQLVAVDKPPGFHVHRPQFQPNAKTPRNQTSLQILRDQLRQEVYPIHRIDRPTSGVVLFAKTKTSHAKIAALFTQKKIKKTYIAVVRGWTASEMIIDRPLKTATGALKPAMTSFITLSRIELPYPSHIFPTSRFSFIEAHPTTGRFHQIRRHLKGLGHPIVGDRQRGDGNQNRLFLENLEIPGLLLKAYRVEFQNPMTCETLKIHARWSHPWHRVFDLFNLCPWSSPSKIQLKAKHLSMTQ